MVLPQFYDKICQLEIQLKKIVNLPKSIKCLYYKITLKTEQNEILVDLNEKQCIKIGIAEIGP